MMPADHLITSVEQFARAVDIAAKAANKGKIVLFGVRPPTPETGYGYIECGPIAETGIAEVRSFKEKPTAETAASYVSSGHHFWNVGIVCMSAATALAAFKQHMPALLAAAQACWQASNLDLDTSVREFQAAEFAACEAVSLDYAILEKAADVCMLAASFQWSDIGSWMSMAELSAPDPRNNRSEGDVVMIDSDQCYVRGSERLIAMVGTHDLIVIDTPDALLVAHRDKAQQVRQVVAELKARNHDAARIHRTVARPWGTYTVLDERERYKIKRIEVNCGGSLSLQMHHHRSEHWVVVSGMAKVTGTDGIFFVRTNESTYIPAGQKHRLENPGKIPLVMIEVQSGEYVGEDDIVRFDDIYGRAPKAELEAPI
jgi:mannose-1-phosphate guanylyltransferase